MHKPNCRILVIHDSQSTLYDIEKMVIKFGQQQDAFHPPRLDNCLVDFVLEGDLGVQMVKKSIAADIPYALVIADRQMGRGWDGIETLKKIWDVAPKTQALICTNEAKDTWVESLSGLGYSANLLILRKPFNGLELELMINSLLVKWNLQHENEEIKKGLKEAFFAAEAGMGAKHDFLAVVSHEFRTPLNIMLSTFDYISSLPSEASTSVSPTSELTSLVQGAKVAGLGLVEILNDIFDYLDLNRNSLEISAQTFDIIEICEKKISYFTSIATRKKLRVRLAISGDKLGAVIGDERRVCQVLTHLLDNAIRHTDKGEVVLRVNLKKIASNVDVMLEVKDTGEGIASEKLSLIFEPFKQLEDPLTRKYPGIGLGLSLCKLIIERMGGGIFVKSEVNKGTTFTVQLQLKAECQPKNLQMA